MLANGQVEGDVQKECTIYVRNLDERVTEKLLEELFSQVGPVVAVVIRGGQQQKSPQESTAATPKFPSRFAFIEFSDSESVLFACEVIDAIELYGQKIKVQPRDNTLQKNIYTQLNMHTASWNRHHSHSSDSPSPVKPNAIHPQRFSDVGINNRNLSQSAEFQRRIVTFNHFEDHSRFNRSLQDQATSSFSDTVNMQQFNSRQLHQNISRPGSSSQHFLTPPAPPNFYHSRVASVVHRVENNNGRYTGRPPRQLNYGEANREGNLMGGQEVPFSGRRSLPSYREHRMPYNNKDSFRNKRK